MTANQVKESVDMKRTLSIAIAASLLLSVSGLAFSGGGAEKKA